MRWFAFLVCAALAGCVQIDTSSDDGSPSRSTSEQCINGVCRTCTDGVCTGPLEDLQAEAAKSHADFATHETHELSNGLSETTWAFWVDQNATASFSLRVSDLVTGQASALPSVCFKWQRQTGYANDSGSKGDCSGSGVNAQISISGNGAQPYTVAAWESLEPGQYRLSASADPQLNNLAVDIVVDNP